MKTIAVFGKVKKIALELKGQKYTRVGVEMTLIYSVDSWNFFEFLIAYMPIY